MEQVIVQLVTQGGAMGLFAVFLYAVGRFAAPIVVKFLDRLIVSIDTLNASVQGLIVQLGNRELAEVTRDAALRAHVTAEATGLRHDIANKLGVVQHEIISQIKSGS